jgi:hypothetical protein
MEYNYVNTLLLLSFLFCKATGELWPIETPYIMMRQLSMVFTEKKEKNQLRGACPLNEHTYGHEAQYSGVEITTRQLAKREWNLEFASNFLNLLASLASVFFLLSVSLFSGPAN